MDWCFRVGELGNALAAAAQGVTSFGPPATTAISRIFLPPPSTMAEMAEVSAQTPFG